MKKILLSLTAVCAAFTMNAQVDTLTEFFTGTPTLYSVVTGGYVTGSNGYDDAAKFQRFDAAHGIAGGGMMTGCLLWVGAKADAGGSFDLAVVDFTGGALGAPLASETISLASVDTSAAGLMIADGAVGYNVVVTFSTPIPVSAVSDLAIGIILPATQAAGDTVALISNTGGDFADATTHTWEVWSDFSLNNLSTAWGGLDIALAVYPIMDFVAGINENTVEAKVYPNPASDVLNINASNEVSSVSIIGMDGKVISTTEANGTTTSVNVAALNAGVYFYEVVTIEGTVRNTFVKK
jgi:hypothetical protein|tara:strand:+ start:3899 stop:4783 length:885 start_codon:yes stop_codon:yes gene_type:complete